MSKKKSYPFKILLNRVGRYKKPFYSIVVVDRFNKIIEKLGSYDPRAHNGVKSFYLNKFLLIYWLYKKAVPSLFLNKLMRIFFSKFFYDKY
jgi:ribosomal protein S16